MSSYRCSRYHHHRSPDILQNSYTYVQYSIDVRPSVRYIMLPTVPRPSAAQTARLGDSQLVLNRYIPSTFTVATVLYVAVRKRS